MKSATSAPAIRADKAASGLLNEIVTRREPRSGVIRVCRKKCSGSPIALRFFAMVHISGIYRAVTNPQSKHEFGTR